MAVLILGVLVVSQLAHDWHRNWIEVKYSFNETTRQISTLKKIKNDTLTRQLSLCVI